MHCTQSALDHCPRRSSSRKWFRRKPANNADANVADPITAATIASAVSHSTPTTASAAHVSKSAIRVFTTRRIVEIESHHRIVQISGFGGGSVRHRASLACDDEVPSTILRPARLPDSLTERPLYRVTESQCGRT